MAVDISNDAARDVEKAEQKAQKTMETAAKVAGATGHKEVEAGLRIGAKLFKVIIPVFLVLVLLFLYALPTMIFETLVEFMSNIKEVLSSWGSDVSEAYSETLYSGEYGGTIASFFPALRSAIATGAGEVASGIWNKVKTWGQNIFKTNKDEEEEETDVTSELLITQDEDAETEALWTKIDATKTKFESRAEDIEDSVSNSKSYFNQYIRDNVFPSDAETSEADTFLYERTTTTQSQTGYRITTTYTIYDYYSNKVEAVYNSKGFSLVCSSGSISDANCIALMAAKTVMEGANISDLKLSDYMKWLGYPTGGDAILSWLGIDTSNYSFTLTEWGNKELEVVKWAGSCLPYYLVMQKAYEDETYGDLKKYDEDYYYKEYGVGALDLFTIINFPDPSTLSPSVTTTSTVAQQELVETNSFEYDATEADIAWSEARGYETPMTHVYEYYVYKIYYKIEETYTYTLSYSVSFRGVDDIADILGISLDKDTVNEYYGIVEETTYAAAGNTEGPPETVD